MSLILDKWREYQAELPAGRSLDVNIREAFFAGMLAMWGIHGEVAAATESAAEFNSTMSEVQDDLRLYISELVKERSRKIN
jgi:hypothetical protein